MATNAVAAGSNADPSNSTKDLVRIGAYVTIPFKLSKRCPRKTVTTIVDGQPVTGTQMELVLGRESLLS